MIKIKSAFKKGDRVMVKYKFHGDSEVSYFPARIIASQEDKNSYTVFNFLKKVGDKGCYIVEYLNPTKDHFGIFPGDCIYPLDPLEPFDHLPSIHSFY